MTPPDFRRILTAMPRDPSWTEPSAGDARQLTGHRDESASRIHAARPHELALPTGTAEGLASENRDQFPDANRSAFDAWFASYQGAANSTVDGLGYHQQALGLSYLMSHDAVAGGNAEEGARRLHQFNAELERYITDAAASPLSNEDKLAEIYGVILQPAMALSARVASSEMGANAVVQAELRTLTERIRQGFERMVTLSTGDNLQFFHEFSQAQVDLMGLLSQDPASPGTTLRRSREVVARLDRAVELSRSIHATPDTPLADFVAIVQNYAPLQRAGVEPPTDSQIARGIITGNTVIMVSTLASEIDLSHRVPEGTVNERYFRFSQAIEALIARNPQMNFREALEALRNLRWKERIYDAIAESNVPVDQAVEIFSGRRSDDATRNRLRDLIRRPGEPLPSDAQIVEALTGTPRLRQIVPTLLSNLIHYLDQTPESDPNRRWIVDYFRARDPEPDISLLQRDLLTAVQTHHEPSEQVRTAIHEAGEPGRRLVDSVIQGLRQEAEMADPPRTADIPEWLTRLAEGTFARPTHDTTREVHDALQDLSQRLARGEHIREGQDRIYDDLVNILMNARDRDAVHVNDLLTVGGAMDDDHEILTQIIDLDSHALEGGSLGTSAYVHRWADGVLSAVERHSYNYAEAFIHDEENHPASFRVIARLIGGNESTSLGGQLRSLTEARLSDRLTRRAQQMEAAAHSTVNGIGTAMASWENVAFTGMMFGSSQAMTRALTGTETVASGARISLGNILPRFVTRSPFTTAALTSVSVGMGYALANEQYNQVHHRPSSFGSDFLVSSLGTMAILSPLWMPSWIARVRTLPQFVVNHPILTSVGAGSAYAGFMRLSDSESNLVQDFGIGTGASMAFLAPAWAPRIPIAGSWVVRGARGTGSVFSRLGTVAEGGELGVAGHGLVAGGTGIFVGGLGSALQAGRDSAGGYETHFWQDLRSSTISMGVGLAASSLLSAAVRRPLMNLVNRRMRGALAAESTTSVALSRSRLAEAGLSVGSTLLSASIATAGMLAGTTLARAWVNGRPLPAGEDLHFTGEELGVTFLNMLAFEMLNNAANRLMLRSTLGRVRATQVDHWVERLMRGTELPAGENPETMRNFLWNRLALEMMRGTDLSPLNHPEVIQNWQASFRDLRGGAAPESNAGGLRGFASRLIAGTARSDIDSGLTRSRPGLLTREGRYAIELTRRAEAEDPTLVGPEMLIHNIGVRAVQSMVAGGRSVPPSLEVFVDRQGRIHYERPSGDVETISVPLEFARDRIYISPRTRRNLDRFFSSETDGALALNRILSLHGEAIPVHPMARAYTQFLAQIRRESPRTDLNFVITRANPNRREFAPNLIYTDGDFEVYSGPVESVPEDRRGHVFGDILIPGRRGRGAAPEPTFRVRFGEGHWDTLPLTLRTLFANLSRSEGVAPALDMRVGDEAFRIQFQSFFVGETQILEKSHFEDRVDLPDDFRIALMRTGENEWRITNRSTDGTTIRVGDRTLRNRDFTNLSQDAEITVMHEGEEAVTLRFRLPGGPEGSGGSTPPPPPSPPTPPPTPPTPPPAAEPSGSRSTASGRRRRRVVPPDPPPSSSSGPEGSGNPPVETAPSASQPLNSEGTSLSLPVADPALAARIQSNIRQVLVGRAQSRLHRDSPTAGAFLENSLEISITLDLNTGELVDPFAGGDLLSVTVRAQVDANQILLSPEVRQELQRALSERELSPAQRAGIEAVGELHGQEIVPSSSGAGAASTSLLSGGPEVLPVISPEHVESMRQALRRLMNPAGSSYPPFLGMTSMHSGPLGWDLDPIGMLLGNVTLDAEGNITAAHLARPDFASPRGTTYRAGIVGGGMEVPVLLDSSGTLYRFEMPEGANAHQTAAMMALENSPQNTAARDSALSRNPYVLDVILRQGPGNLLHDLNPILTEISRHDPGAVPPYPHRISLWRIGDQHVFALGGSEREQGLTEGGSWTRVAVLELRFRPRSGMLDSDTPGRFSFEAVEGELPVEIRQLLEFVQSRVERGEPVLDLDPTDVSEREEPLPSEPTRMGPAPEAPPAGGSEPDTTRILNFYYQDSEGQSHPVALTLTRDDSTGNWMGTLGRRHFPFLQGGERTISREHLRVRVAPDGEISYQEIDSPHDFRRGGVLGIQTGATAPRADFVLRLAAHGAPSGPPPSGSPGAPPSVPPAPLPPDFTRMVLRPGERRALGPLLGIGTPGFLPHFGISRGPEPDSHNFWLLSPPGHEIALTREYNDTPGRPQRFESGRPLLLGELGEQVWLQVGGQNARNFPIFLDDQAGSGRRLPRITLEYHGQEAPFRFRSSSSRLHFGREYSPEIFTGVHRWISGHHFTLSLAERGGVRGYMLNVHGRFGLYIGGMHLAQGQGVFLPPGYHELHPIVRTRTEAEGNPGAPELDRPIQAALPPIDIWLPAWTGSTPVSPTPLTAGSGRGEPTTRVETPRPAPEAPRSEGLWEWFRNLFR